ncbi:MAG: hypothetical protein UR73_C0033G0004 [candidate division WS6 bacterium GW2011_GWF1_35_23]|uniref:Uncharacterized protein n=1 Tax=candidate division WS6 bacterium GW2011_GWF1_35_23 TaxID=1619097 RepID=A0A0G0F7G4_9BACT|nr:MAG: hypothetical protein UR73_C0033G0004 [candidate division WS6 bacterium GW2011_GWF1_35_23]
MNFQEARVWLNSLSEKLFNEMGIYALERGVSFRAMVGLKFRKQSYTVSMDARPNANIESSEADMRDLSHRCMEVLYGQMNHYLGSTHCLNIPVAGMEVCLVTIGLLKQGEEDHKRQYNAWIEKYFQPL